MQINLGFIGCGNMGAALVRGIVKAGKVPAGSIFIYDVDKSKTGELAAETGVKAVDDNGEVIRNSDVIILAVKPGVVRTTLEPLAAAFDSTKVLVSIAAGITIKTLKEIIGNQVKIVRTMPNTPALVSEGMTILSYDEEIDDQEKMVVKELFKCVGGVEVLDEKLMSEVIAVTSSSPAYVFMFIEAMADAGVQAGLQRSLAYKLAAQAVLGSAKMVLETGKHPGELKDMVCSPAGTTIEAVHTLEKNGFRYAVIEAMRECTRRAREIGKES